MPPDEAHLEHLNPLFRPAAEQRRTIQPAPDSATMYNGNGRATWHYGPAIRPGVQHVIWRRIGTHDILTGP
ncbi:hypothetical protein GCM10010274_63660 [Streptomyces lavendofoliae]|uniref:Uncharacterized protein n=1 Tax=Streptomyces lavendofoliae TaxID=67314 RepID=A0A918M8C3_9ACTN|nr:hypothetical protein GCM10010274_63660 [Streptomyces lavendofoliae]